MTVRAQPHPTRHRTAGALVALTVGAAGLAVTATVAAYVHVHPGPTAIDRWGFSLLAPSPNSPFFRVVAWLGTIAALALGSIGAAMIALFRGQRLHARALACLVGPAAAAAVNGLLMKPVVHRLYVGELSFASGSVVVIAGVSTAWVLAVPRSIRPLMALLGSLAVALMIVAVVVMRWHYPTDALIGVPFAIGMVLVIDGAAGFLPNRQFGASRPGRALRPRSVTTQAPISRR